MHRFVLHSAWLLFLAVLVPGFAGLEARDTRFTDNKDGTVTDHLLDVMWAATDNQGDISWKQADKWVKYTFPYTISIQYDNWRMPTIEELESLYVRDASYNGYETDCGQTVRIVSAIQLSCGFVWSKDEKSITAGVYNFNRGFPYTERKVHIKAFRVLPVRTLE